MKILALLAAVVALAGCTQIDTGNVGVESTMGQVKPDALPPGVYGSVFKTVHEIIAKEVPFQINDLKPQTSDKISLADLDIDVYVKIDPVQAPTMMTKWPNDLTRFEKIDGYALGLNYVTRQARGVVYDEVAKHNSATIHTKRNEIEAGVTKSLQTVLDKEAGKGMFTVIGVNVRNIVTDPALEANIKAAANAQFALQKSENESKVATQQAEVAQRLALQAEENALKVAKIQAERKKVEASAEADSMRIKAESISKAGGEDYVRLQAIAKWNGVLPASMPPNGTTPFVNVK